MSRPKFTNKDENFAQLKDLVIKELGIKSSLKIPILISIKALILFLIFCILLFQFWHSSNNPTYYLFLSFLLGVLCLPLILNIGHEAVHGNLSSANIINTIGKSIFYFLGTSTYFWSLRHLSSHHTYTNVKNWDLDIEQSKIIRLSKAQTWKKHHQLQPYYMGLAFLFYTLNWFFFRDFKDVFTHQFGSSSVKKHPRIEVILLFLSKIWHLLFLVFIPIYFGVEIKMAVLGFFIFHLSASAATTFALISTHIGENQEIISVEKDDNLPYSWIEHQLKTTADFGTNSLFYLHFFGGFNHHVAHHLFPTYPHIYYPKITKIICSFCEEKKLSYSSYPNLMACVKSHFKRLKKFSQMELEL